MNNPGFWERTIVTLCECELGLVPEDVQGTIKPATGRDSVSWRWERSLRAFELDVVSVESDAIVVEHSSGRCKAEDVSEVNASDRSVNVAEMIGTSKPGVVVFEIGVLKETVGVWDRGDVCTTESLD